MGIGEFELSTKFEGYLRMVAGDLFIRLCSVSLQILADFTLKLEILHIISQQLYTYILNTIF